MHPGQTILHYRILEPIGKGGMGEVYKAEDLKLGRTVALKVLPASSSENQNSKRRLLQEARAASALNHPNIVTIYSIEEVEGFDFLVMEYVEGETLKSVVERGALETSRLTDLGVQIAEGLSAAHAAGFIHRDIKPANVLVTPRGQAKILDFGLAKLVQVTDQNLSGENTMSRLTQAGMIVGTIAYMSPEQTRGEPLDARTDIFSLGCVLYEAATGKAPFAGPSVLSVLHEIATVDPPAPSAISSSVPQGMDSIIRRALVKDRSLRYSSAAELASALRGLTFANRYQILRELGRGGMGVVYLARDPILERDIAIKVIPPEFLTPEAIERFKREARVVAKMDHPAIVGIHDIGEHDGSLFLIMPFVKGTNLRAFLREGSLSLGDVIDIGIQTAEALDYSHSLGVVHRDVKPENIMVSRSGSEGIRVRVMDFGLAMAPKENRLTRTGAVVGTVTYLSPEQVAGRDIDARSDIYSLGTVLYECILGTLPFSGEVQSVLYRIAHEAPESLRSRGAEIQEELESIILQCLEKDPAKRPQVARQVADALVRHRSKLRDSDRMLKLSMVHRPSTLVQRPAKSAFVGREKEFVQLQRRLNAALQGECQFAVVGGEAGIGKSRLLEELEALAEARKVRVLHGRFVEQDQSFPYQGFCDAIQEFFRKKTGSGPSLDFSDLAADLVSLFPMLRQIQEIGSSLSSDAKGSSGEIRKMDDRTHIYELLAGVLIRISEGKPLLLLLEDLHSADVSVDALQYIVRRLGPTPTLIVGTYRTTEVAKRHPILRMLDGFHDDRRFETIRLEPFLLSEHRAFLESIIGTSDLETRFVEKIYEATEGNPYFTKELVRSLMDSGKIAKSETGAWSLSGETDLVSEALPATIQQTVEKRIERLAENVREALSLAAVLGKTFEFHDLEVLGEGSADIDDAVERLLQAGFIEEERGSSSDQLRFSSGVVRDVLYAALSRRKRKVLHRKYAEYLENKNAGQLDRVYPQLVHHYANADAPAKAIEFGLKLAQKSLEAFSGEDAVRTLKTVLNFVRGQSAVEPALEVQARTLLAQGYRIMGHIPEALEEFKVVVEILERQKESAGAVNAMVMAAETAWDGRRVDETKRWLEKGLEAARRIGQTADILRLLSLGATLANLRGEYAKAKEYLEEADRIQPVMKEHEEETVAGGRLVVPLPVPVQTLHPAMLNLTEELEIIANVFETLITADADGNLVPSLAENWEARDQARSFVFTLRKGVRVHDGRSLTADEVKKSIERSVRLSGTTIQPAFGAIRGVSEYLNGSADHIQGILAQSEDQLEIQLREPLPIYPALLADFTTGVTCEVGDSAELSGTGPFKIRSFQPDRVILERNPDYWKEPSALLDSIEFRTGQSAAQIAAGFRSGEFDVVRDLLPEDLEEILRDRRLRASLIETPKKNIYGVMLNSQSPHVQSTQLRQALGGIVRSHDLVWGTLGRFAQPAEGLFPPGILGHDPGRRRTSLLREKAMELLRTSGVSLPIQLKASAHPTFQDRYASLTQALLKTWSDIGIHVSIETSTMDAYLESWTKTEGFDLMIGRWNADYDDPDNFTYGLFHSGTGIWSHYYSSPEIDRLTEEARAESRTAFREKLYRKVESLLLETGLFIPLFHDIDYRIASPKVKRLKLLSSPPYVNYSELGKTEVASPVASRKSGGGVIHIPFAGTMDTLDPSEATTSVYASVVPSLFETLTREGAGARIVPWLAAEFHAEQGGARFRFRLRDDIRFHDGRRVTARDVRYSFEHLLQNPRAAVRVIFAPIRGARELIRGNAGDLTGFQIQSTTEFTIDLDQPLSFFPALLAFPPASIIPEGSENFGGSWKKGCVGTGPFRLIQFESERRMELEANPLYWRKDLPKSDGLAFSFGVAPADLLAGFRAGQFSVAWDLLPSDVEALRRESEFASRYRECPSPCVYYVALNANRGPLADERLRRQVFQAIDIETVVRRNMGRLAIPAHSLIPPGFLGYEARKMAVSQPDSQSVSNVELSCMIHSTYEGPHASLLRDLINSLERRGFRIKVLEGNSENYQDRASRYLKADLDLTRWFADYPDTDTFIHGLLQSETGIAGSYCGAPDIDRLIQRGRTETDPEVRHDIYREVEGIVARRALVLPLFHEQMYAFGGRDVEGFEVTFSINQPLPYEKFWLRK